MEPRPYHHNNLRVVLLEQAEEVLRTAGADGLSLRDLARRAGVSHGAPRSHFIDRRALLDALAERGFQRLAGAIAEAVEREGATRERFRRVGRTFVDFAVHDTALMELMFATKVSGRDEQVQQAATQLFGTLDKALTPPSRESDAEADRDRFKILFAAVLQGTATLIATERVSGGAGERLIDDAVDLLLDSELGRRLLPGAVNE